MKSWQVVPTSIMADSWLWPVPYPGPRGGAGYYGFTKSLSLELCQAFARLHRLQVVCFLYCHLGARPTGPVVRKDFHPFSVVWEDVVEACRLAIELDSVPGNYQCFKPRGEDRHGAHQVDLISFEGPLAG